MQSVHKPRHKSLNLTQCFCVNKKMHLIFFPSNIYFFKRGTENRKRKKNFRSLVILPFYFYSLTNFLAEVLWRIVLVSCQLYGEGQQMAEGSYCFGRSSKELGQRLGWGLKNENGKWGKNKCWWSGRRKVEKRKENTESLRWSLQQQQKCIDYY